jgi:LAO/AO transport system kinase
VTADKATDALLQSAAAGDSAAVARLITIAEVTPETLAARVWHSPRRAHVVGVTGSPGTGKSTLTSELIRSLRADNHRVAVLAVDPSSKRTGGAILGDRIRMGDHVLDRHVFIRSVATRGSAGGLSATVPLAVRTLEACGFTHVIIETVGVGQIEIDIAIYADTVCVVVHPRWGDTIQANKAGIVEIADVFVVNKADLDGAHQAVADLRSALEYPPLPPDSWRPPIVETIATNGRGIDELRREIDRHRAYLGNDDGSRLEQRRTQRTRDLLASLVAGRLDELRDKATASAAFADQIAAIHSGVTDPWSSSRAVLGTITLDAPRN